MAKARGKVVEDNARGGPGREATVALLIAGLMLFLGQTLRTALPEPRRWAASAATILGLLLFLLAIRGFSAGRFPSVVERPLRAMAGWLGVSPAQAIILGLAPLLSGASWLAAGEFPRMNLPALALFLWVGSAAFILTGTWRDRKSVV